MRACQPNWVAQLELTGLFTVRLRVIESGVHHRIMRLHRPWMVKGLKNPKYRASYEVCLQQ